MKTLKGLVSSLELESLFHRPKSLMAIGLEQWINRNKIRLDKGKYSGDIKGKPCFVEGNVLWYTRNTDKDGAYYALWTIDTDNLTPDDSELYAILENVASKC